MAGDANEQRLEQHVMALEQRVQQLQVQIADLCVVVRIMLRYAAARNNGVLPTILRDLLSMEDENMQNVIASVANDMSVPREIADRFIDAAQIG